MFRAKQHIVWRKKKKLIVLLNTKSGSYFTLNPTAQFLWMNHIVDGTPLEEVVKEISKKYANPPRDEQILADCTKLISDWKDSKLIEKRQPVQSKN